MSETDKKITSVILSGVGGQGVLLAARILSEVALRSGLDVKSSEVHGMSQRGGSVLAQVRFGPRVYSPLTPAGTGDYLMALEELESLRYRGLLKKNGRIIMQCCRILPSTVVVGGERYPEDSIDLLEGEGYAVSKVNENEVLALGGGRFANIFLLGMLSRHLDLSPEIWKTVVEAAVPERFRKKNLQAFEEGREL